MKYQDNPQFDYETFKVLYDINPQLQKLIRNFDQEKIELAIDATDNLSTPQAGGTDTVGQMAQRATNLGWQYILFLLLLKNRRQYDW